MSLATRFAQSQRFQDAVLQNRYQDAVLQNRAAIELDPKVNDSHMATSGSTRSHAERRDEIDASGIITGAR
jgi:hypothetical protein